MIFSDKAIRHKLEEILHPLVRKEFKKTVCENGQKNELYIFEVPLLFEVGWQNDFDHLVTVYADRCRVIQRICQRDNVSAEHALSIVQAQMPVEEKILLSDSVIDNSGHWLNTSLQIYHLCHLLASKQ